MAFGGSENKKLYNGYELQNKEFSDGTGLEWYDYKHRFYDDQTGRFFVQDELATEYVYYSPYQFAGNEVPNAKDLDGLEPNRQNNNLQKYVVQPNVASSTAQQSPVLKLPPLPKQVYQSKREFVGPDNLSAEQHARINAEVALNKIKEATSTKTFLKDLANGIIKPLEHLAQFAKGVNNGDWRDIMQGGGGLFKDAVTIGATYGVGKIASIGLAESSVTVGAVEVGVSTPSFIVSEGGTVFPIPKGATGPIPAASGKGFQFVEGGGGNGLSPKVTGFRFMDQVTTGRYQYPGGYGSYFNTAGQTVNPLTGQTIAPSNPWWHIPAK